MVGVLATTLRAAGRAALGLFTDQQVGDQAFGLLGGIFPGGVGAWPKRGTRELLAAYSTMPWLRASTHKVATSVGGIEWQLFVARRPGGRATPVPGVRRLANFRDRQKAIDSMRRDDALEPIFDHPFLTAWNHANAFLVGPSMRKLVQIYLDIVGEAFLVKERNGAGATIGLWPIPPNWVLSTPTPDGRSYRVSYRGWQQTIPETEVLWLVEPDPSNPYGRGSGIAATLSDELETDEYAAKHSKLWFLNRARPDLIITAKNTREPEMRRMQEDWQNQTQGVWRAWRPYFVNRELEIKELEQSFRNMQFVQIREHERDCIMQVYGVPPEILGVLSSCVDEKTECLTRAGWQRHDAISTDDWVATWNADDGVLE